MAETQDAGTKCLLFGSYCSTIGTKLIPTRRQNSDFKIHPRSNCSL